MHTTALLLPLMLAARYGPGAAYTAVCLVRATVVGAVRVGAAVAGARHTTRTQEVA